MAKKKNARSSEIHEIMKPIKKVAVIGLGYVGLPLFIAINKADRYEVVGYEISEEKVRLLNKGKSPIADVDVEEYLKDHQVQVSGNEEVLKNADVYIVCVPTPVHDDFNPNYGPVIGATQLAAKYMTKGSHFVLESTVNPGTCDEIVIPILEEETKMKAGQDFNVAHCPERINPGDEKWSVYNIPRNIGSADQEMNQQIADFYRSFITKGEINEVSSLKIAEATKIVENTFRDINIAYVNELAQSFDAMGIDLYETIQASSNKPFGFMPHWPGCGVGGHCIAVDPYYLIKQASKSGFDHKFLKLAREINNNMPKYCVEKLTQALNDLTMPVKNTRVALLGLSYKPDVGDIRESPSLEIKAELESLGADLKVYDPYFDQGVDSLKKALAGTEAVVIATAHQEFIEQLPDMLKDSKVKVVMDGRNCLDKEKIEKLGIKYLGIGR